MGHGNITVFFFLMGHGNITNVEIISHHVPDGDENMSNITIYIFLHFLFEAPKELPFQEDPQQLIFSGLHQCFARTRRLQLSRLKAVYNWGAWGHVKWWLEIS